MTSGYITLQYCKCNGTSHVSVSVFGPAEAVIEWCRKWSPKSIKKAADIVVPIQQRPTSQNRLRQSCSVYRTTNEGRYPPPDVTDGSFCVDFYAAQWQQLRQSRVIAVDVLLVVGIIALAYVDVRVPGPEPEHTALPRHPRNRLRADTQSGLLISRTHFVIIRRRVGSLA